ncbi:unnamed protein product, partial [Mesorhabditis belari]|uniref:AAA+ ATPase domain-containing protein n=1 Tax=Mesorhabditis belari TaxID=2138241 RepID=A0AAF3FGX5_9BILA
MVTALKGREKEFDTICDNVRKAIATSQPITFYLSGLPGTGKTATVYRVIEALSDVTTSVFINCASVNTLKDLTTALISPAESPKKKTRGRPPSLAKIAEALSKPMLVILDEIDHLSSSTLLYSVFRWPQEVSWKLIVIGIANSIDLTERLLPKLKLTIPPITLPFAPYNKDQLKDIIAEKLQDENSMDKTSLELCARKIAAVSGDARSAVRVIKQAKSVTATPTTREVLGVLNSVYASPLSRARLPLQSQVLLAVCLRISNNKKTALTRFALYNAYSKACTELNIPAVKGDDLETAWGNIESQSLASVDKAGRIRLQIDASTARSVIANSHMISQIDDLNL